MQMPTCSASLQVAVDVEFLRMEFILDFEVTEKSRLHSNCKPGPPELTPSGAPCKWAWTTQQFYFERCAVYMFRSVLLVLICLIFRKMETTLQDQQLSP